MYSISYAGVSIGCVVGGVSLYIAREIAEFKGEEAKKSLKTYIIGIICVTVLTSTWLGITMGDYIREGDYSKYSCGSSYCKNPASYHVHFFDVDLYYCDEHAEDAYKRYDFHRNSRKSSSSSSKSATCKFCGRSFEAGDSAGNFMNIAKTGMCNNCYRNFKSMTGK